MKILFSPSESKISVGSNEAINKNSFIFPKLFDKRILAIQKYMDFIKNSNQTELEKLFGTKKKELITKYSKDIFCKKTCKAVLRYDGVAFKALNYKNLSQNAQKFIDENVIIFSNLFGPILAKDLIPEYKLKQGENIKNFAIEDFYMRNFTYALDEFIKDDEILDLRASFYEKFYKIKKPYLSMKFIKNGKILSHFAKHCRGEILKEIASKNIKNIKEVLACNFNALKLIDIKNIKYKTEITYEILSI